LSEGIETDAQRGGGAGEEVVTHEGFPWLARAGLLARGIVYGIIGLIAIEVAFGSTAAPTNQQGALEIVAGQPLGSFLLAFLAAGLAGYSAWRLTRAVVGHGREEDDSAFDRLAGAASGIAYLALFFVAIEILFSGGGSGGNTSHETAGVLGWTAGTLLVTLAGAVLVGIGAYQGYKGLSEKFMATSRTAEMSVGVRRGYKAIGVIGHLARGIVFVLIGYGLIRAAVDYEPSKASGLDGALRELAQESYGQVLLGVVAAGLIAFAFYSMLDARYRKV
jgi:hypothetical protein